LPRNVDSILGFEGVSRLLSGSVIPEDGTAEVALGGGGGRGRWWKLGDEAGGLFQRRFWGGREEGRKEGGEQRRVFCFVFGRGGF
jgi:hypothetical protein